MSNNKFFFHTSQTKSCLWFGNFQLSLVSATSYESRYGAQVFAATAQYRSVAVRIKELKFSKKKDISRDIMKEMRLLREIRHDNINLFLGAAIEPMRILLLTDYCAKGSLYVSKNSYVLLCYYSNFAYGFST